LSTDDDIHPSLINEMNALGIPVTTEETGNEDPVNIIDLLEPMPNSTEDQHQVQEPEEQEASSQPPCIFEVEVLKSGSPVPAELAQLEESNRAIQEVEVVEN